MIHIYKEGQQGKPVFVLLHGTGGSENDLLNVGKFLDEEATVLSVRGNVNENGMNRFFKRKGFGEYDMEDLEERGKELADFIKKSAQEHNFSTDDVVLLGFSNGANIAINVLLREDTHFKRAFLFSPLYPVDVSDNNKDLSDVKIFTSMGENDPMASPEDNQHVIDIFEKRGADVEIFWGQGHELNAAILRDAREWLNK